MDKLDIMIEGIATQTQTVLLDTNKNKQDIEPILKRCRTCGKCSEQMDKCPICKDQFKLKWFGFLRVDLDCIF